MQESTKQEPRQGKTIHIGYLILILVTILAAILAVIFVPRGKTETPITPTPTVTATPVITPAVTPVSKVTVSIGTPANVSKNTGRDFHVYVNISKVNNILGAQYDIKYDPKVITVIDVAAGKINGAEIPVSWSLLTNTQGTVRIINLVTGTSGMTGEGYLADIHFQIYGTAAAGASSAISFVEGYGDPVGYLMLGDADADEIPSKWVGGSVAIIQ